MDRTSLPSHLTDGLARQQWGRRVRDALLLVLVMLVAVIVGLLVLIAAAAATAVPALFLLAGLAAFCATLALGLLVVTRRGAAGRRRRVRPSPSP